jgi:hypothetical protein
MSDQTDRTAAEDAAPAMGGQVPPGEPPASESVWTFRGYRLKANEFNQAMIHFFRSQVARADVWRQRLDMTTNWAVLTTGATISVAFTRELGNHSVIILDALLVTLFLFIEARRYREGILHDMKRGVTAKDAPRMYTGAARTVLMCALTVTEVARLRAIVSAHDPKAVLIVSPAQEVSGGGFAPLRETREL